MDFDVPLMGQKNRILVEDETRIELALKTIKYLLRQKAKVIIIAHLGRPGGKRIARLSLKPVVRSLRSLLGEETKIDFSPYALGKEVKKKTRLLVSGEILVLENLRFYPEEKKNQRNFARELASLGDFYVNDAFAVSHREHASIVGIPRFLPSALGKNFIEEVKVLTRVYEKPKRPVVLIIGGMKESKLQAGQILLAWVDSLLVGGGLRVVDGIVELVGNKKVMADLTKKGEDITVESAREFARIVKKAGTIIWSGPMGAYENPRFLKGTEIVAKAVVSSKAYSVVGGGDTEAALTKLNMVDKINHICSGGGAMLVFLAQRGTLPAIEVIIRK